MPAWLHAQPADLLEALFHAFITLYVSSLYVTRFTIHEPRH